MRSEIWTGFPRTEEHGPPLPCNYAHFEARIRALKNTRTAAYALVANYRHQLAYLDTSEGNIYEVAYRAMGRRTAGSYFG